MTKRTKDNSAEYSKAIEIKALQFEANNEIIDLKGNDN